MSLLQRYFLRIYALERHKGNKSSVECYREALYRARFLAFLPATGVASGAIAAASILSPAAKVLLKEYRPLVIVILLAGAFVIAFAAAGRAIKRIDDIPAMAASHDTERDRLMSHVSFWSTLLLSIAVPIVVALLLRDPSSAGSGS